jgi:hypothetical protein
MKPCNAQTQPHPDDPLVWVGGEATVGSQAGRHIRRQEGHTRHLLSAILGLTFLGGLALGGAISRLCRSKVK